ncbi:probable inactive receptor kinase At1g48480 [Lycium ferocissimum]|uniref:probable inactive receptor kinase At1g48480 n=1 Tax=Lycium ferocissimum TaxID=112874 RepID=UPI002815B0C9|nr:probable inactive receptor kinase At1g48480 [Lycium ferocissimum]
MYSFSYTTMLGLGFPQNLSMLLFFVLFYSLFTTSSSSDLNSDRDALLALRAAVGGRTYLWNTTNTTPCKWAGISCENNRVTVLRLPASSLIGNLPVNTISNLTKLRTISLRFNRLSGSLPSDFSKLTELRNLYLQENNFTGDIPSSFFTLHFMVRLDLSNNNFTGEIPTGFNNLTRLRTLMLEKNQFSGSVPELKLPKLVQFNVSGNSLNGSIPKSLESMPVDSFSGNSLCGKPLEICPGNGTQPAIATGGIEIGNGSHKKKKLSGGAIAGIVIGSIVGFVLLLLILFVLCRKRTGNNNARSVDVATYKHPETEVSRDKPSNVDPENGGGNNGYSVAAAAAAAMTGKGGESGGNVVKKLIFFGNSARVFDLEDLLRASAEVLGKGTFGTAYKAVLEMGTVVAVKRLKDVTISEMEFREKIDAVGAMNNENLVPLRAYYYSREEKLLVYDYMPMGSLSALLHGNKGAGRTPLDWEVRSSIALGTARGVEYLHSQGPSVSHGNIKSSNVLLTKSYDARVSDFGLAQLVGPPTSPTRVAGYRAPEVTDPRKVSQKADVYSFGVLLLELLTGKAPTHALLNEEGVDLPRWVQSIVKEQWTSEVFDIELLRYQSVEEEMVQLLQLAIDCAAQYPDHRPSMSEVCERIQELRRSSVGITQEPSDLVDESD